MEAIMCRGEVDLAEVAARHGAPPSACAADQEQARERRTSRRAMTTTSAVDLRPFYGPAGLAAVNGGRP
jgi:hypothetical protein